MLEYEIASAERRIIDLCGDVTPYYWEIPENFKVPSVYFPMPEVESKGDTLTTYRLEFVWYIKCFASTSQEAYDMALGVVNGIRASRNAIPIINPDGSEEGRFFRLRDPTLKLLERGTCQITIRWRSSRDYIHSGAQTADRLTFTQQNKAQAEARANLETAFHAANAVILRVGDHSAEEVKRDVESSQARPG